jgi:hypothetical protein
MVKDLDGCWHTVDGAEVIYAEAFGQKCILYFENKKAFFYSYPLCEFRKKIWQLNFFRKVDRSLLIKICKVIKRRARKAFFANDIKLTLGKAANSRLIYYLEKYHKKFPSQK